ncbi:MAG TPA: GNAT family N-acetyltransferase [Thermoplasmata archaeon]|nr:GNAT family N-acetyltransferase [Thermoplasmata archaeon]
MTAGAVPATKPPSPPFQVRPARWADIGQLVELYIVGSGEGRRFYHPFRFNPVIVRLVFTYFVLGRRLVPALMRLFPHRAAVMIVAQSEETGEVIGFGTVRFVRRPRGLPAGKYGFLVDQRYRGRGIGTKLGEAMLATSRSLGLTEGVATILRDNQASIKVAQRFGFRVDPSSFQDRGAPGQPTVEIQGDLREVGHGAVAPLRPRREPPPP